MANESEVRRLGTSLRDRPVKATLAIAQKLAPTIGVTHLLDVTPLDHLGLPVFMSVMHGSTSVQVHSGKGLARDVAEVGALMEAIEHATCEAASRTTAVEHARLVQLERQWPDGLRVVDFVPRIGARPGPRSRIAVVRCERLATRRSTLLPAELVLMPPPPQRGQQLFGSSSNGLASGNTLAEATLHALLEVIERDTVTLNMARDESRSVVMTTLPPPFSELVPAWRRQGVRLHVRYLPNELNLPCFEAWLQESRAGTLPVAACSGWGLHFDRHIALSRAICEAAQSRLSVIHADRTDLPGSLALSDRLGDRPAAQAMAAIIQRFAGTRKRIRFEAVPHEAATSVKLALRALLNRLPNTGMGPVFRFRFHLGGRPAALKGLHVVKVVVARAETPVGNQARIGPRLLLRLQGA